MINEFHGQEYPCSTFVPTYGNLRRETQVCSALGSVAGQSAVSGTTYMESAFRYDPAHKWRYNLWHWNAIYCSVMLIERQKRWRHRSFYDTPDGHLPCGDGVH